MLIIVEGPPGAGKTSLTDKLRTALVHQYGAGKVSILHGAAGLTFNTDNSRYLHRYLDPLEDYVPGEDKHIICDEWHWGLPALKNTFNQSGAIYPYTSRYISMKLAQLGAVIVHLNPATDTLRFRMARRSPYLAPSPRISAHLPEIRSNYTTLSHDSEATVLPSTASLTAIIDTARHLEERSSAFNQWSHSLWPFYLGSTRPKGVLLDLNPQQYETLYPEPNTGSSYLHRGLFSLPPEQRDDFGMLNVAHVTSESFINLMVALKAPKLIALGKDASAYLDSVAHTTVPHQSHSRRFHPTRAADYAALLHSALSAPAGTDLREWNPS